MAIGINPDSMQWTLLKYKLDEVGQHYLCGDYSHYDASLSLQLGMIVAKAANTFYNDGDENKRIRNVLIKTLFASNHLVDTLYYSFKQGNPSGDALTSIINCVANMALHRYVYLRTVESDLYYYNSCVRGTFYGDDSLVSVGGKAIHKMTMPAMQKELAFLGISYTSASKGKIDLNYVEEKDITFLKRGFVWDRNIREYLSPLDYDTVIEIPRWCMGDCLDMNNQMSRFNQCLMFLSAYGELQFDMVRRRFVHYCRMLSTGSVYLDGKQICLDADPELLFTFERCKKIFYPMQYGPLDVVTHVHKGQ